MGIGNWRSKTFEKLLSPVKFLLINAGGEEIKQEEKGKETALDTEIFHFSLLHPHFI